MRPLNLRWCDRIAEDRCLPPRAKLVGMVLATRYADHETLGDIRPGVVKLAKAAGISTTTVDRALAELRDRGFIVKVRNGGKGVCTLYRGSFPTASAAGDNESSELRRNVREYIALHSLDGQAPTIETLCELFADASNEDVRSAVAALVRAGKVEVDNGFHYSKG